MKKYYILIFCVLFFIKAYSQASLSESETKLYSLFEKIKTTDSKDSLLTINEQIEQELNLALQNPASFDYSFESLEFLGKIYSDDTQLRIYTWNIPFSDGTYTYGGIIQQKTENIISSLKIKESSYKPNIDKTIETDDWYGALYYKAFLVKHRKTSYYVLLGWAGNNDLTTLKLIDALSFNEKTGIILGLPVFRKNGKEYSRILLEYGNQNQMTLDYDDKKKQIVFDHLSPSSNKYEGIYSDYGPDFSYDSYQLNKKNWLFKEDVDVRNKE